MADFPVYYSQTVFLLTECIADYLENGECFVYDHKIKGNRRITEFRYTADDLYTLLSWLSDYLIEDSEEIEELDEASKVRQERIERLYGILWREREKHG